jgi:penicillin-insensitive murein endopeptidase
MTALFLLALLSSEPADALSLGRGGCGALQGGAPLACSGANFESATSLTCKLGRHHLHPLVVSTVEDAYALLAQSHPRRRWQYGEMGFKDGGSFKPHHTHQNGRSADFFFPAVDNAGRPDVLPVNPVNLFGYRLHFTRDGHLDADLHFDATAVADHLLALEKAGRSHGVSIERIILDAAFQARVLKAQPATQALKDRFNKSPVWIAHDQHYHVDFDIPAHLKRPRRCGT